MILQVWSPHSTGSAPMATREYVGLRPTTAQFESETLLLRAVEHLCAQETVAWSIASLSAALGIPQESFRKEFGTEETLVERAWDLWPQLAVAALVERLGRASTGREAIHDLLEMAITLQTGYRRLRDQFAVNRSPAINQMPDTRGCLDRSRSLACLIQARFARSVYEGELPESANVAALSTLCLTLVNGLVTRTDEDASTDTLLDSVKLFVDGLGFQRLRRSKRVPRRLTPVLAFVRKPQG